MYEYTVDIGKRILGCLAMSPPISHSNFIGYIRNDNLWIRYAFLTILVIQKNVGRQTDSAAPGSDSKEFEM